MAKTLILSIGLVLLIGLRVSGQDSSTPYYYFEGDEVVFEFDVNLHDKLTEDETGKKRDFEDLKIYEVALSGEFNNWSREGWKMKKVSDGIFQLRKKISDFNDDFKWEFKFFVNGKYWAEPSLTNNLVKVQDNLFWEDVYNISLYNIHPNPNGNAAFFLPGHKNASKVILAGTFNGWHERMLQMIPSKDGWELRLQLDPGYYEYKFIVDGEWMEDPKNPKTVINIHGTLNSVLLIKKEVTFRLEGFPDANKVILAGSFNDWKEDAIKMQKIDGGWVFTLNLVGGKHLYKFIVDGNWMVDPYNPYKEYDHDGHLNSVMMVQ